MTVWDFLAYPYCYAPNVIRNGDVVAFGLAMVVVGIAAGYLWARLK